jgi:hypothetical protein
MWNIMSSQSLVIRFMTWIIIAFSRVDVTRVTVLEIALKVDALWSSRMAATSCQIRLSYVPEAQQYEFLSQ